MTRPRPPLARTDAAAILLFLLVPLLLWAIVLTAAALFSSPAPQRPADIARLVP